MYPANKGKLDLDYYIGTYMPMSIELMRSHLGFIGVSVERGLAGGAPGTEPTYVAMCHFLFDSMENFTTAFNSHEAVLQGDMPNYTDIEPVIKVSEVAISR
jgi:uncharacterized protein (TIGR02118 family)